MAYKGTDLNLRAGSSWPPRESAGVDEIGANGGWSPMRGASEPIAVDETVLACCNNAYDVAQVHGAGEMRLEHLLYALTRIRPAIDLLEQLGVRTGQLRNETAIAIASEVPSGNDGKGSLRAADEVREVLQRAASLAAERRLPASVADLLRVLLSLGRKAPATALLMRAATDPVALERWRDEVRRDRDPMRDPPGPADLESRAPRPNLADALFKRLDGMEAALRGLQSEVAAERRTIADALAQRIDAGAGAGVAQMQAVAAALEDKLGATVSSLGDRLAAIDKLGGGESLAYLGARIEVIEKQIARQGKDITDAVSNLLLDHMVKAEEADGETGVNVSRLSALEASIDTHLQRTDEASRTHEHSLAEIYEALVKLGTNQQTLASNLNTWRVESSGDVSIISNRLEQMERTAQETLGRLEGRVQALRLAADVGVRRGWMAGFKRWLYGTTSVLSGAWRDNPEAVRANMPPARPAGEVKAAAKPAAKVEPKADPVVVAAAAVSAGEEKKL